MHPVIPIALVFVGCCSNVIFLELIVKDVPSSGNIITFAQFLFITIEGFIFATKFGSKKPVIPIRTYVVMVLLFFVTSAVNNYALNFHISMPLHMIFRAGSLMANLILGVIILKKSYPLFKYVSVMMIVAGIAISTIASSKQVGTQSTNQTMEATDQDDDEDQALEFFHWTIGISLLTLALFLSARMGIYQETVYKTHGKHPSEALFYNHALPLPLFLFLAKDIYNHVILFNNSAPLSIGIACVDAVPRLWLYLLGNVLTQYVCIRSVFILTTECASLTVTLVVTLRKFISLIFSILYFQNPFTSYHVVGTVLVFGGTLVFTEVLTKTANALLGKTKRE